MAEVTKVNEIIEQKGTAEDEILEWHHRLNGMSL